MLWACKKNGSSMNLTIDLNELEEQMAGGYMSHERICDT